MRPILRVLLGLPLALSAVSATAVQAARLPSSFEQQLTLDFDLRSKTPAPPFDSIQFRIRLDDYDPTLSQLHVVTYAEPGGGVPIHFLRPPPVFFNDGLTLYQTADPLFDPIHDGVFSIGLYLTGALADLREVSAAGVLFSPNFATTEYQTYSFAPSSPVSEPAPMTILMTGLAVLAARRRKLVKGRLSASG